MPSGGFGNLIALPLQWHPRERANSVFVDDQLKPHSDQWAFLATVRRLTAADVDVLLEKADADHWWDHRCQAACRR